MVPSERFVTDITGWPAVNDKVLAAKGAKVEGEALRSGKRYIKPDGTDYKNKPRTRDQKATLEQTPVYPDSFDGRDHILQCGAGVFEAFLKKQNETEETVWAIEKADFDDKDMAHAIEDDGEEQDDEAEDDGEVDEDENDDL